MPELELKACPAEFKASASEEGVYEGYFSIVGNRDDGGDRILPGAFAKTLAEQGRRVKVFYQHDSTRPLGPTPDVLREDSTGLYAQGHLTISKGGVRGVSWADDTWALMKDHALDEGSIGYQSIPAETEYKADGRDMRALKLFEISPVSLGMNPLTAVAAVKAASRLSPDAYFETLQTLLAETKEGRRLSAASQAQIAATLAALGAALTSLQALGSAPAPEAPPDASEDAGKAHHAAAQQRLRLLELQLQFPAVFAVR